MIEILSPPMIFTLLWAFTQAATQEVGKGLVIKSIVDKFQELFNQPNLDVEPLWDSFFIAFQDSFELYAETFDDDQSNFLSFGWLTVHMPYYKALTEEGNLVSLKCDVRGRGDNQRPLLDLQEVDHSLYYDTHYGVSLKKAYEISSALLHP